MKKYVTPSNIIFVVLVALLLYKPSKTWIIRQIAFAPSIEKETESPQLTNYNWSLKGLNTPDVDFNNLKGKVIFINYWATWCPNCVAEKPMLQQFYNDYKDKIVFLSITNEDWQIVNDFFKKDNYNLPTYNLISTPPKLLDQTNTIPATYILDKKGRLRVFKTGAGNWNSKKFRNTLNTILTDSTSHND